MADGELIEEVADKIEEVAEVTRHITGREVGFLIAGAGVGVAVGFGVGYFVLNKRVQTKYEKICDIEVDKMRQHYVERHRELDKVMAGPKPPIDKVMRDLGYLGGDSDETGQQRQFTPEELEAIDQANRNHPGPEEDEEAEVAPPSEPEVVVEEHHVFVKDDEVTVWDYAVEVKQRRPDVPYIIHADEYTENEHEHEQVTYTYYEVDDILADSHDQTIDDMDAVIGLGNLGRWGHGSQDPNVVFVRNEELKLDLEIIRDRGSYDAVVRGTIRHSSDRRRRPQRGSNEDD